MDLSRMVSGHLKKNAHILGKKVISSLCVLNVCISTALPKALPYQRGLCIMNWVKSHLKSLLRYMDSPEPGPNHLQGDSDVTNPAGNSS